LDGYKGRRLLGEINFPKGKLRQIEKWKAYPDYLRDVVRHKIVLQLDRQPCAGPGRRGRAPLPDRVRRRAMAQSNEIAFSKTCGEGKTISEIASTALNL